MRNEHWSDRDLESLFVGQGPTEGDLACLSPLIEALRREARALPEEAANAIAPLLAEAAREAAKTPLKKTQGSAVSWRRRYAIIGGTLALATVGVGGVAAASDGAAPGDFLYPVDRALEVVGIGNGGTQERLNEAMRLSERGQPERALEHAAKAVEREGDKDSARALVQAAVAVQNQGAEQSVEVRAQVSEMLQWMGSEDPNGKAYGQGVSERTNKIKETASRGKSGDAPGQNKEDDGPGRPGGQPTENPGKKPENPSGPPENPGGPPENPGKKPENPGQGRNR